MPKPKPVNIYAHIKEKPFQADVIKTAEALGWLVYHTHDSRRSAKGFPDLVLVHHRHGIIFAELKTEKGTVSPEQTIWHETIALAGGRSCLWRPSDIDVILDVLKGEFHA